jgi:hypothetical protein
MSGRASRLGGRQCAGFCLVEVLIATGLLASALVAIAYVFTIAAGAAIETRAATSEVTFAAQAGPFDDLAGEVVEYLDASGRVVDDTSAGALPSFARRSRIEPSVWDPDDTVVIRVDVSKYHAPSTAAGGVHLVTVKTRKGP